MGNCLKIPRRNNRVSSSFDLNGRNSINTSIIPEHPRYPPPPRPQQAGLLGPDRIREAWAESRETQYTIKFLEKDKIFLLGNPDEPCSICLEETPQAQLNCGHNQFCYSCMVKLVRFNFTMNTAPKCPICRKLITSIFLGYTLEFNTGYRI
jgi:hypothetical protein